MQKKLSALWIAGWFPSQNDPFSGNFIERHAVACSMHTNISLIHVSTHKFGEAPNLPLPQNKNATKPYTIYFKSIPQFNAVFFKPINLILYYSIYWLFVLKILKVLRPIDVIHVHAPDKCGLIGVWLKQRLKKPLVLTEHWAIYNTPVDDHFHTRNYFFKYQMRKIWENSDVAAQVSLPLHREMEQVFQSTKNSIYFPNVVDAVFFKIGDRRSEFTPFKLVHVSNGEPRKNVFLIFQTVMSLQCQLNLTIDFVGFDQAAEAKYSAMFNELCTASNVSPFWTFHGRKCPSEIKAIFDQANCLVMASSSENAPCVISEALCADLPVVSSHVGGIADMVDDSNGNLFKLNIDSS